MTRWLVGDRVRVKKSTAFTAPDEPGTITATNQPGAFPIWVTLDNGEEPFDVIAVHGVELEALSGSSPSSDLTKENPR